MLHDLHPLHAVAVHDAVRVQVHIELGAGAHVHTLGKEVQEPVQLLGGQVGGGAAAQQNGAGLQLVDAQNVQIDVHLPLQVAQVLILLLHLGAQLAGVVTEQALALAEGNVYINIDLSILGDGIVAQQPILVNGRILGNGWIMNRGDEIAVQAHQALTLQIQDSFKLLLCALSERRIACLSTCTHANLT